MPFPLIPVIAAGASALGGVASGVFGNKARKKAATTAHNRNLEQWKRQNQYNDPSAQMARLKQAGLNPNMVYGQASGNASGQAGQAPSAPVPQIQDIKTPNMLAQYSNMLQTGIQQAQKENIESQTGLNQANTAKTGEQATQIQMQNFIDGIMQHNPKYGIEKGGKIYRQGEAISALKDGTLNLPALTNRLRQYAQQNFNSLISENGVQESTYRAKLAQFGANNSDELYIRLAAMYTIEQGYDLNSARGIAIAAQAVTSIASLFMKKGMAGRRPNTNRLHKAGQLRKNTPYGKAQKGKSMDKNQ